MAIKDDQEHIGPEFGIVEVKNFVANGGKVIVCLAALIFGLIFSYFWLPARVHYHITETFQVVGGSQDAVIDIAALVPISNSFQEVKNREVSSAGDYVANTFDQLETIEMSIEIRSREILRPSIEYDVVVSQGRAFWKAPVEEEDLLPQEGIESDHPILQKQADEIRTGTPEKQAFKIYSFTSEYLSYSFEHIDCTSSSALETYLLGACVCSGYSRLMVALCRALEIPSQMVVGVVLPDPIFFEPSQHEYFSTNCGEAHAWVVYFSDGKWSMADPTYGSRYNWFLHFNRNDGRHLFFGEFETMAALWEKQRLEMTASEEVNFEKEKFPFYIAAGNTDDITIVWQYVVTKKWDGRWVNAVLVWMLFCFLLCRYRYRIIR